MLPKQRQDVRRVVLVLAEPLACIGKHSTCHYLLSTTTTNHSLSTNVALPNLSMNIFQGLTKQAMKSIVQSPSPAAQLREFLCNHILQYVILCCSHCYCEQHAEPLACIGPKFSSRALRLQLHMFHLCVIVCCFLEFMVRVQCCLGALLLCWNARGGGNRRSRFPRGAAKDGERPPPGTPRAKARSQTPPKRNRDRLSKTWPQKWAQKTVPKYGPLYMFV